ERTEDSEGGEFAPPPPWGELVMTPREAFLGPQKVVKARDAVGRGAAESLAAYPPGIPNVLPGERLTAETLDYIEQTIAHGGSLRGASDRARGPPPGGVWRPRPGPRLPHAFAADRLHQAVPSSAAERERRELGVVHGQAERPQ